MIDFCGKRKLFYAFSALMLLGALLLYGQKGLNFSIEFSSGSVLRLHFDDAAVTKADLEKVLETPRFAEKFQKPSIVEIASKDVQGQTGKEFQITSAFIMESDGETQIDKQLVIELQKTWPSATALEFVNIGAAIGDDLKDAALISFALSVLVVLLYISFRFEFRYAVVSIIAVVHDTIIVMGIFAFTQEEFASSTIAAVLTLIGYSLNDTIIVLDRIRENTRKHRKEGMAWLVNHSINETLSRTVKTSGTTFVPVIIMFLFGGMGLHSFAMVLLVGIIIGTYSSICLAAPILVDWKGTTEAAEEAGREAAA